LINERKKDKLLSPFNIDFLDHFVNFTSKNAKAGSCFEINGSTCTGKTEILIHIISTILINNLVFTEQSSSPGQSSEIGNPDKKIFVLNKEYDLKYISQCETIYYFDCDNRFNFARLVKILKFQLLKKLIILQKNKGNDFFANIDIKWLYNNENDYQINNALSMSLKYFNIIKPINTFSLIVSLIKLKDLYPTLLYIMIDSISMFYYIDIEEELSRRNSSEKKKMDYILSSTLLYRQLNKLLKLLSHRYKITLFLTTRNYKKDYHLMYNDNQAVNLDIPNENLINTLYHSSIPNNHNCMEYFVGLQNNQLVFKNILPNVSFHQDYSVFHKDLINFKLVLSRHPECSLEIPEELKGTDIPEPNTSKFVGCLTAPAKTNILEFEINDYGIF
ncbi:hypothetical protein PIROE2DRAFT_16805, partial [Piromyces sp. E2]